MVGYYIPCDLHIELTMSSEDQTNLHLHARHNAQEAIVLAKQRAQDFDTQAALERKTNEALRLAKGQAHLRDDDEEEETDGAPLVDCTHCPLLSQAI
jgi:DNA helicase INO80